MAKISEMLEKALNEKDGGIDEETKKTLLDGIIDIEKKYAEKEKELKKIQTENDTLKEENEKVKQLEEDIKKKENEITDLKVEYIKTFNGEKEIIEKGKGKINTDDMAGNPDIKIDDLFKEEE